jgi:hypothetical protein
MPDLSAPITPQEAERVWKSQARPSARGVATAMTRQMWQRILSQNPGPIFL